MLSKNDMLSRASLSHTVYRAVAFVKREWHILTIFIVAVCVPLDILTEMLTGALERAFENVEFLADNELLSFSLEMFSIGMMATFSTSIIALTMGLSIEGKRPTIRSVVDRSTGTRILHIIGTGFFAIWYVAFPQLLGGAVVIGFNYIGSFPITALAFLAASVLTSFKFLIDTFFSVEISVFERTYYMAAVRRSQYLIQGARLRLICIGIMAFVVVFASLIVMGIGMNAAGFPEANTNTFSGLLRFITDSFIANTLYALYSSFLIFIYIRRRQELNDLTFFDLSGWQFMPPAVVLLEKCHD